MTKGEGDTIRMLFMLVAEADVICRRPHGRVKLLAGTRLPSFVYNLGLARENYGRITLQASHLLDLVSYPFS
jgi:hypothetical protein